MSEDKLHILVSFTIYADDITPDEITEALQIQPDRTAVKGSYRRNERSKYPFNLWMLDSKKKVESNRTLGEHIDYLLDLLHPHAEYLSDLSKDNEIRFLCTVMNDNHVFLENDTIRRMGDIGVYLDVTVYDFDDDEDE